MFKELYTDLQSKLDLPFVPSFLCCCIGDLKIMLLEFMSEVNIAHPMNIALHPIGIHIFLTNNQLKKASGNLHRNSRNKQ
jgi:hypothetical protein